MICGSILALCGRSISGTFVLKLYISVFQTGYLRWEYENVDHNYKIIGLKDDELKHLAKCHCGRGLYYSCLGLYFSSIEIEVRL